MSVLKSGPTTAPKVREPLLKRPLDVILSTIMLILSLPVSLPIAIAIRRRLQEPIYAQGLPAVILAGPSAVSVAGLSAGSLADCFR